MQDVYEGKFDYIISFEDLVEVSEDWVNNTLFLTNPPSHVLGSVNLFMQGSSNRTDMDRSGIGGYVVFNAYHFSQRHIQRGRLLLSGDAIQHFYADNTFIFCMTTKEFVSGYDACWEINDQNVYKLLNILEEEICNISKTLRLRHRLFGLLRWNDEGAYFEEYPDKKLSNPEIFCEKRYDKIEYREKLYNVSKESDLEHATLLNDFRDCSFIKPPDHSHQFEYRLELVVKLRHSKGEILLSVDHEYVDIPMYLPLRSKILKLVSNKSH
ncbi:hypothetical protein LX81_02420 [Palleronia aestuarii]|uniref:Uncharacterized protein n=1 Tax=Palleronia aestuarii TaxID=568105 RepID=A0A2W7NCB5_9RHOB|nr:hypothetical protein [Palleronia aestuarii]PZX15787.1 hypothetical protein LX81_02420 [Palleronia aestuarii]